MRVGHPLCTASASKVGLLILAFDFFPINHKLQQTPKFSVVTLTSSLSSQSRMEYLDFLFGCRQDLMS